MSRHGLYRLAPKVRGTDEVSRKLCAVHEKVTFPLASAVSGEVAAQREVKAPCAVSYAKYSYKLSKRLVSNGMEDSEPTVIFKRVGDSVRPKSDMIRPTLFNTAPEES